jgi:RHS repeat-associated protein
MPGRRFSAGTNYRYGFNGKENDKDIQGGNDFDYGFRIYNASLAKFLTLDPLSQKYPELTPYQFASNNPICGIDLDGLEFFYAADGKYIGRGADEKNTRVFIVTSQFTNQKTNEVFYIGHQTNVEHNTFQRLAAASYGEARTNNHDEIFAFGNSFVNKSQTSGTSLDKLVKTKTTFTYALDRDNARANDFLDNTPEERNSDDGMRLANAGIVNAIAFRDKWSSQDFKPKDYSNDANSWDGNDVLSGLPPKWNPCSHYRQRKFGNRQGISDPGGLAEAFYNSVIQHFQSLGKAKMVNRTQKLFIVPSDGFPQPKFVITATYGTSVFYKEINDPKKNKAKKQNLKKKDQVKK